MSYESDKAMYERVNASELARDEAGYQAMIAQGGRLADNARNWKRISDEGRAGVLQGIEARAKEKRDREQAKRQSLRAGAEEAFEVMISACTNEGQVAALMKIKTKWISEMSTGEVPDPQSYLMRWRAETGTAL